MFVFKFNTLKLFQIIYKLMNNLFSSGLILVITDFLFQSSQETEHLTNHYLYQLNVKLMIH